MKCLALAVALCLPAPLLAQQSVPEIKFKAQTRFLQAAAGYLFR